MAAILAASIPSFALGNEPVRYLTFQIFTGGSDSTYLRETLPPAPEHLRATVADLRDRIGGAGRDDRRLGFVLGPLSFDNSDESVRDLISTGFDIALETGVAVGFHIDDSMFWGRRKALNTPNDIEWLDWKRTLSTGRRLDWSSKPTKIMPQLCINSRDVKQAVTERARLIGNEVAKGVRRLRTAHREDLYLGLISGWETQIGRDFDTGASLGYCALANAGFDARHPPADRDVALGGLIDDFIDLWARSLAAAGAPREKIYSHVAYLSKTMYDIGKSTRPDAFPAPYLQTIDDTPPAVAFCAHCRPGFSTYPQPGHLEQWRQELDRHGDPPWASSEGTAIDPGEAERSGGGMDMERYLGNLFNRGAVLVNVFGWGVGAPDNPFRRIAENESALAAYRKFLNGETLAEAPIPVPAHPSADLMAKIRTVQTNLPGWIRIHGPASVRDDVERLERAIQEKDFATAAKAADAILKTLQSP